MTNKLKSIQSGASKDGTGARPQGMQSSSAVLTPLPKSHPISDTSDSLAPINQIVGFQATPNSLPTPPNVLQSKLLHAFVVKLGTLLSWHRIELGDGRTGWALFFDAKKWVVDPLTHELTPLGEK